MPTNLLGTFVPDYPYQDQEICHLFCVNYLLHRGNPNTPYHLPQAGIDAPNFLFSTIKRLNLNRQVRINPGNLILIGTGQTLNGAIGIVTHSMIAITQNIWFGCNNVGTFGPFFIQQGIPADSLFVRREINLQAANVQLRNLNLVFDILG